MLKDSKGKAYMAVSLTIVIWAVSLINSKIALEYFNAVSLAFWRFFITATVLFLVKIKRYPHLKMQAEDRRNFLIAGFTGIFLYYIFQNTGITYAPTSVVAIILSLIPVLTMVVESLMAREKITLIKSFSVMLSVVGVVLVVGFSVEGSRIRAIIGAGFIMLAVLSWIVYTFTTKSLNQRYSPFAIIYYQSVIGTILLGFLMPFNWSNPLNAPIAPLINMIYIGTVCTAAALLMYAYALDKLSATVCNIFMNLLPGVTIIAGYVYLHERISLIQLFGTGLILSSIFIITGIKDQSKEATNKVETQTI
jgi:drug/metabolite transporter (DMT)-like permease